jgi:hypothetical protein
VIRGDAGDDGRPAGRIGRIEQPALDERLGRRHGPRQHVAGGRMRCQLELLLEDLAHLAPQRVAQVRADQQVEVVRVDGAVEQVELGGEFDVAQAAVRFVEQEIELPHRFLAVPVRRAHLQAMRGQLPALGEIKRHQLFGIQAEAG